MIAAAGDEVSLTAGMEAAQSFRHETAIVILPFAPSAKMKNRLSAKDGAPGSKAETVYRTGCDCSSGGATNLALLRRRQRRYKSHPLHALTPWIAPETISAMSSSRNGG